MLHHEKNDSNSEQRSPIETVIESSILPLTIIKSNWITSRRIYDNKLDLRVYLFSCLLFYFIFYFYNASFLFFFFFLNGSRKPNGVRRIAIEWLLRVSWSFFGFHRVPSTFFQLDLVVEMSCSVSSFVSPFPKSRSNGFTASTTPGEEGKKKPTKLRCFFFLFLFIDL